MFHQPRSKTASRAAASLLGSLGVPLLASSRLAQWAEAVAAALDVGSSER